MLFRSHLERADPNARIIVRDNGKGIDAAFLPFVFDRFAQQPDEAKNTHRHSGLGLGLSLARHLVELHGGTIEAASEGSGCGATFTLEFPLRAIASVPAPASTTRRAVPAMLPPASLTGLRVLVVDDEADARALVAAVLKQAGAQVTQAASADDALAQLTSGNFFDALVSDIGMPDKDGYMMLRAIRQLPAERGGLIPAVALTAFGRSTDRIRALAAGFQAHIPKPVEPVELVVVIASLVGRVNS